MDVKKVAKFIYKNVRIITDKGKVIEGYFEDFADMEDVDVYTLIIDPDRQEDWGELIEVPYTEIESIEVVE
jgi:hypothetical protein